ncbi:hypothetical protein [Caulobacter sp. DWR3-1-2]|uniref:hypothetical protein n=1 Tax=Caulobacter sp. DWR3-1-2 TaxID=2804647 RepID=UPI003CEAD5D8
MEPRPTRNGFTSALCYRDPNSALKFLEAAFGFDLATLIEDAEGDLAYSEMKFGDSP